VHSGTGDPPSAKATVDAAQVSNRAAMITRTIFFMEALLKGNGAGMAPGHPKRAPWTFGAVFENRAIQKTSYGIAMQQVAPLRSASRREQGSCAGLFCAVN
jgi:hypothetical protein